MAGEIEAALLQDSVPDLDRIASHLAMTMHILANEIGHMEIHDHDEQPR